MTGDHSGDIADPGEIADDELAAAVRRRDDRAADELFRRHAPAARRFARSLTDEATAEDLVSEAFTRLLAAFRAGNGPQSAVRPYLLATLRNAHVSRVRAEHRLVLVDDLTDSSAEPITEGGLEDRHESDLLAVAFRSLPPRWQTVLWHTSVEGEGHQRVGELLGLSPNAVGALAFRAREGLRRAYLEAHLAAATDEACRSVRSDLPAYVRDRLDPRRHRAVDAHLRSCAGCTAGMLEVGGINDRLGALLAPALLGAAYGERYLAGVAPADASVAATSAEPGGRSGGSRRTWRAAGAAAVAVLVAVVAWWAFASAGGPGSGDQAADDALPTRSAPPVTDPSPDDPAPSSDHPSRAPSREPAAVPIALPSDTTSPTTEPSPTTDPTSGPTHTPTATPTETAGPGEPSESEDVLGLARAYQSDFGAYRHVQFGPTSPFADTFLRLEVSGLRSWVLHDGDDYRAAECRTTAPEVLVCHVGAGDALFGIDLTVDGRLHLVAKVYAKGYDDPLPGNNRVVLDD